MVSNRALLFSSVACALVPPLSLVLAPIPTPGPKETFFLCFFGVLVPAIWLALAMAYYRRARTKRARWLFALTPVALIYPLGALILALAALVKPGRW